MLKQEQFTSLERKIERFSKILEQKPGDGLTVLALAEASFRRGLKLEALTAYQVVTNNQPVPEAHLAVAEIYSQQNMTSEAYGELRELFKLDPTNVEARLLAQVLQKQSPAPDDVAVTLNEPTSDEAFAEAKLRLQIQRTIHNRELQERTRNVTLEPGVVIHEYYVAEAKKKLIEVDEQLRELEELKLFNTTLKTIPRPTPVSAEETQISADADAETDAVPVPVMDENMNSIPVEESSSEVDIVTAEAEIAESDTVHEDVLETAPEELVPGGVEVSIPVVDETPVGADLEDSPIDPIPQELSTEVAPTEIEPLPVQEEELQPEEVAVVTADLVVEEETGEEFSPPSIEDSIDEPGVAALPSEIEAEPEPASSGNGTQIEPQLEVPVEDDAASFDPANLSELPPVPVPAELPTDLELTPPPVMEHTPAEIGTDEAAVEPVLETLEAQVEESTPKSEVEQPSNSFDLNFSIGTDSPIAPDLPSPGEASPEPLPIQVAVDNSGIELEPEPLANEVSEELILDVGTSEEAPELVAPEPVAPEPVTPEPAAPIEVTPVAAEVEAPPIQPEPVPAVAEVVPEQAPGASAADRQVFYESKAEELGKLTGTLARTRGVTSIFLVARDGSTIDSVVKDNITEERVGELVKESFEFLLAYANSPSYWVLECTGGIFVMQTLDEDHVLIAIGQAGANFGALRYTMDKTKTKFGAILKDVPR